MNTTTTVLAIALVVSIIVIIVLAVKKCGVNNIPAPAIDKTALKNFIYGCPKTDLHLHIESGTNPTMAFAIAKRNGIQPGTKDVWPWKTEADLVDALNFKDLGSFLKIFYAVSAALQKPQDFVDQATNVVNTLQSNNVVHSEIFFDPQTFTSRGISFQTVADNFNKGLDTGRKNGMSLRLIMSVLRDSPVGNKIDAQVVKCTNSWADMSGSTGWNTVVQAVDYNNSLKTRTDIILSDDQKINWTLIGIGLDSNEIDFAPELFSEIYAYAGENGLFRTAHCGEEGPAEYVWTGIKETKDGGLGLARIDHGVHCGDDPKLCFKLATPLSTLGVIAAYGRPHRIPITCCPMSNYRLKVFPDPKKINIAPLLDLGVMCCVNVDDPMYTGDLDSTQGIKSKWVNASWELLIDNCMENSKTTPLTFGNLKELLVNGFMASWLKDDDKAKYIGQVNNYFLLNTPSLFGALSPQVVRDTNFRSISRR